MAKVHRGPCRCMFCVRTELKDNEVKFVKKTSLPVQFKVLYGGTDQGTGPWLCFKDFRGYWHRCLALTPAQLKEIRKLTKDGTFRLS